jgi:UPF0176 protein
MSPIHILLFYKFQKVSDPKALVERQRLFCEKTGLRGRILIAKEGINGSVSGSKQQVEAYKAFLHSIPGFEDVTFKEETGLEHPFAKLMVRVRDEIVTMKQSVDTSKSGKYLSPTEFLELYNKEKDIILLDTRNHYEYELGHFKDALNPGMETFKEFPAFVEKLKDKKDKKIVMYCTGGIRCEKASAYMIKEGFSDVSQLKGGIITFCQEFPNTLWEGKCFVFDKRLLSDVNQHDAPTKNCFSCGSSSDLLRNCKNRDCDMLTVLCLNCRDKLHGCCSRICMNIFLNATREGNNQKSGPSTGEGLLHGCG